jgi:ubiquitin fusion degradation protein 1
LQAEPAAAADSWTHLNLKNNEAEKQDDFMDWEAYLLSQRSRTVYAQYLRCRPMWLLAAAAGYDDGNRVVMPQSALDRLGSVEVEYPLVFKIHNAANPQLASHVGVQEFVAEEGFVHVPTHTMQRLGLHHHHDGQLVLLTCTSLPKATHLKLRPHTSAFLKVKHPKELLERNFARYSCVTVGDTVTVADGGARYLLDVVEARPALAVSTLETDCEVDFLPPLDYVAPPAPTRARVGGVDVDQGVQRRTRRGRHRRLRAPRGHGRRPAVLRQGGAEDW